MACHWGASLCYKAGFLLIYHKCRWDSLWQFRERTCIVSQHKPLDSGFYQVNEAGKAGHTLAYSAKDTCIRFINKLQCYQVVLSVLSVIKSFSYVEASWALNTPIKHVHESVCSPAKLYRYWYSKYMNSGPNCIIPPCSPSLCSAEPSSSRKKKKKSTYHAHNPLGSTTTCHMSERTCLQPCSPGCSSHNATPSLTEVGDMSHSSYY